MPMPIMTKCFYFVSWGLSQTGRRFAIISCWMNCFKAVEILFLCVMMNDAYHLLMVVSSVQSYFVGKRVRKDGQIVVHIIGTYYNVRIMR